MKPTGITVDVNCRLCVSRDTAETCLKLVEMFINSNSSFGIHDVENDDGSITFSLVDYSEAEQPTMEEFMIGQDFGDPEDGSL